MSAFNSKSDVHQAPRLSPRQETLRYGVGIKAGFFGPYLLGAAMLEFSLEASGSVLLRWLLLLIYLLVFPAGRYALDRVAERKLAPEMTGQENVRG